LIKVVFLSVINILNNLYIKGGQRKEEESPPTPLYKRGGMRNYKGRRIGKSRVYKMFLKPLKY